jgi:hypothetical protein
MQHLLLAISIILLTFIAGHTIGKENQQAKQIKQEKEKQKKAVIPIPGERFSVLYSRFDMIVN